MIKPDLAELVDDHCGIGEHRVLDEEIEERGLAGTEKSGEDGDRSCHRSAHMIVHGGSYNESKGEMQRYRRWRFLLRGAESAPWGTGRAFSL